MFEFADFVMRNPAYATKNWRALYAVRKAILTYRKEHPHCEWCGRTYDLQVHHVIPVSVNPYRADSEKNMVCMCRKHHLQVAHNGNFRLRYTPDIKDQIIKNRVIQIQS